jgi:hypothetical protein
MQQRERKGHSFQNRLHALTFFLSSKICLQQLHTQLHTPLLNVGEEGWPMERQKWSKPWKEKEFRPLPHNRPAVVTTTTTTLSKEKTHLHQLYVPCLECLKKKKKLGSYVDDWNHERRGSVTDPMYNRDGREGKTEIEERTMSQKLALKLLKMWGKRSIFPWLVAASRFQNKEGMKTPK